MYNDQLEERVISIEQIFLDPNNPRFWSEQTKGSLLIPDSKVTDMANQDRTMDTIRNHGLDELKNSILRNGFLPLDRIVVRELEGEADKFVVIEGNRRLAALKWLREQIDEGTIAEEGIEPDSPYLENLKNDTTDLGVLVYLGDEKVDIAWILQGIRHIGGIRNWEPAQQGKLVADQIDKDGLSLTQAGQMFGLSAQAVGRRYRSYKALEQMRADPEYRSKALNKYYSLFEEAIRQRPVKDWLGWDNSRKEFTNQENIHQFYEWISPDEEHNDKRRRIHDPRHIKSLGAILDSDKKSLLNQVDNHEIDIEAAYQKIKDSCSKFDWKYALESAESSIEEIPASVLNDNRKEIVQILEKIQKRINALIGMAHTETSKTDKKQEESEGEAEHDLQV